MSQVAGPTLVDVARQAGVSIATASRVLSGAQHVSESRSRAVRKAIADLGYRHNAVASALRSQRTETVGLVLPRYTTGFLSALIESVSAALDDAGMSLVLRYSSESRSDGTGDHDVTTVESLLSRRVDGLIICPPTEDVSRDAIAAAERVPVVQVGRHIFGDGSDSVGLDDNRATDLLVGSLADGGATSLVTVGLSPADTADARRIAAVRASCELRGVSFVEAVPADATLAGGVAAANRLLGVDAQGSPSGTGGPGPARIVVDGVPVDAVVCANDDVAHGLVTVVRLHGVGVPSRLQVASLLDVSFDEGDDRDITTLRHPWPAMGREAVRLLLDALASGGGTSRDDRGGARRVTLAPRLLKGRSSR